MGSGPPRSLEDMRVQAQTDESIRLEDHTTIIDGQSVRDRVKALVKSVYDRAPDDRKRLKLISSDQGNPALVFSSKGDSLEDACSVIDRCHPRYLEIMLKRAPNVEGNLGLQRTRVGTGITQTNALILMGQMMPEAKEMAGKPPGQVLSEIMALEEMGPPCFLRYTDDEKKQALEFSGVRPDNLDNMAANLTRIEEFGHVFVGTHAMMTKRLRDITNIRVTEGSQSPKKYWTSDRMAELDPTEFWSPERGEKLDSSGLIGLICVVRDKWGEFNDQERDLYTKALDGNIRKVVMHGAQICTLMRKSVSDELNLLGELNKASQTSITREFAVDSGSDGFMQQLADTKDACTGYRDKILDCERWGMGRPETMLEESIYNLLLVKADGIITFDPGTSVKAGMQESIAKGDEFLRLELAYHHKIGGLINLVAGYEDGRPELAAALWNGLHPKSAGKARSLWPCQLLV